MPRSRRSSWTPKKQQHKGTCSAIYLPEGIILRDFTEKRWKLGALDHVEVEETFYLASEYNPFLYASDDYIIKVGEHRSGLLFTELQCYQRVGKKELINDWIRRKRLNYLGIPQFYGAGSHEIEDVKCRFLVLPRYGTQLQKLLDEHETFSLKTAFTIGIQILHALEYLHSHGYVHVDVKASNLYLGHDTYNQHLVYLTNFGLACKYSVDGKHKAFEQGFRKAHCGTVEFTSRDSHMGAAHSRRSDLEILGYNLLKWLCGHLPWEDKLHNLDYVSREKHELMSNISQLMKKCFSYKHHPKGIGDYMNYVVQLKFDENPDYNMCRNILKTAIIQSDFKLDGILSFTNTRNLQMVTVTSQQKRHIEKLETPSTSHSHPVELENNEEDEPLLTEMLSTLDNPTPAMLMVLQKKLEKAKQQKLHSNNANNRKGKKRRLN